MRRAFERSITLTNVMNLIEQYEDMIRSANDLWDPVTDCLGQFDIEEIEKVHSGDLKRLGII